MNLANLITVGRIALVPVFVVVAYGETARAAAVAFVVFAIASASDSLDGYVARRHRTVSRAGQFLDPLADKLLILGSLASLALVGDLPWWAVIVIGLREAAVTALRVVLLRGREVVLPANVWGKVKTLTQVVAIGMFLWPGFSQVTRDLLLALAIVLTIWSGIHYAFTANRTARRSA